MVYIPRKSYPTAWTMPRIRQDLVKGGMEPGMASNIADTINKINQKQAVDEKLNYQAIEGLQGGRPYATIVIAAYNSTAADKASADFVCDGTADDVEINAAINAMPVGGKVLLLEGTFNTSGGIYGNAVAVEGMGYGTLIVCGNNLTSVTIELGPNATVANLRVAPTSTHVTHICVSVTDFSVVENVWTDGGYIGIYAGGGSRVQGCYVQNATEEGIGLNDNQGLAFGNYIDSCAHGISLGDSHCAAVGNVIFNCSERGIYIHAVQNPLVVGNVIRGPGASVAGSIGISANSGGGSGFQLASNSIYAVETGIVFNNGAGTIIGNEIIYTTTAIHLTGMNEGGVLGNNIHTFESYGVLVDSGSSGNFGILGNVIIANPASNPTPATACVYLSAVSALAQIKKAFISGNKMGGLATYGVRINNVDVVDAVVVGNDFRAANLAITTPISNAGTGTLLNYPAHATYGDNFT